MDDSEQVLAKREFQSIGVCLNLKNNVYNYNVEKLTEQEKIHQSNKPIEKNTDGNLSGALQRSPFGPPSKLNIINVGRRNLFIESGFFQYEEEANEEDCIQKKRNISQREANISKNIEFINDENITSGKGTNPTSTGGVSFSHKAFNKERGPTSSQRLSLKDRSYFKVSDNWLDEMVEDTDKANTVAKFEKTESLKSCLLYTSPSPRDGLLSRMPSSA